MGEVSSSSSVKRSYALVRGAKVTPLPINQVVSLLLIQLCESMQINILFPFLVFMVEDFGYTGEKLGLYAGFLAAAFCGAQFCSAVFWGKVSDRYGRRFALLCGVIGSTIAILYFGFASSYFHAVMGRAISGLLNGNVGVLKSLLTEITDETNRSKGFSYLSLAWGIGTIAAPLVGGALCRPAQKFPSTFGEVQVFVDYPYLLPCLAVVFVQVVGSIVTYLFLKDPKPAGGGTKLLADAKALVFCRGCGSHGKKTARSKRKGGVKYEHVSSQIALPPVVNGHPSSSGDYGHFVAEIEADDRSSEGTDIGLDDLEIGDKKFGNQVTGIEMVGSCDSIATTATTPIGTIAKDDAGDDAVDEPLSSGTSDLAKSTRGMPTTMSTDSWQGADMLEFTSGSDDDSDCDTVTLDLASPYELEDKSSSVATSPLEGKESFNLLSDPILVRTVLNYGLLAMAYIVWDETLPMYFKLNSSVGGLSMGSSEIGLVLTAGGVAVLIFTLVALPALERRQGKFWLMNVSCVIAIPVVCAWPALTYVLVDWGETAMWIGVCIFICLKNILCAMSFTAIMIMVNHTVTDDRLGEVNGFGQSVAAMARAVGPAAGGALWSLSVSLEFVYFNFMLTGMCLVGCIVLTAFLPRSLERKPGAREDNDNESSLALPMH